MPSSAFVGIDVAFAKRKRLPVALCVWDQGRLVPRPVLEQHDLSPPRGQGNVVAALDPGSLVEFADEVVAYLRRLEDRYGVSIRRIAIDAPSDPRSHHLGRRRAEEALDARRISCFNTPSAAGFRRIREKVRMHLRAGGRESNLPHANQLWMLVGFALFERLRRRWECLEVYPQATVCLLGANVRHKKKIGVVSAQLAAALPGLRAGPRFPSSRPSSRWCTAPRMTVSMRTWQPGSLPWSPRVEKLLVFLRTT